MKKKIKKLHLVRNTLAHLRNAEQEKIQGGDKTNGRHCYSHDCGTTFFCGTRTCY